MKGPDFSDYTQRLVFETEGYQGCAIRGWYGEDAKREAEREEYDEYLRWQEHQESHDGT